MGILDSIFGHKQHSAPEKPKAQYDIFNRTQRMDSDFDQEVRGLLGKE